MLSISPLWVLRCLARANLNRKLKPVSSLGFRVCLGFVVWDVPYTPYSIFLRDYKASMFALGKPYTSLVFQA